MGTRLFIGSLAWATTDQTLSDFFSTVGTVVSAKVMTDRATGRSRGFGFVEMTTAEEAQRAIQELNEKDLDGRNIIVNEAKEREDRGNSFGGGNNSRGGDRGGDRNNNRSFNSNSNRRDRY